MLLLGSNGQVGRELTRSLAPLGDIVACDRAKVDFNNIEQLRNAVKASSPDIIVNAVAYTQVDMAEQEPKKAYKINVDAVAALAEEAKQLNACLIHYSTDYIFDGKKDQPYHEDDVPNPLSVYGITKLESEHVIRKSHCHHIIFRTSWVYSEWGNNFLKKMMGLLQQGDPLEVVCDQVGVPTSARLIADVTVSVLKKVYRQAQLSVDHLGTYNLVALGDTSWHKFACFILERMKAKGVKNLISAEQVMPTLTKDYKALAPRPKNSRLSTHKLEKSFNVSLPCWQEEAEKIIDSLLVGN